MVFVSFYLCNDIKYSGIWSVFILTAVTFQDTRKKNVPRLCEMSSKWSIFNTLIHTLWGEALPKVCLYSFILQNVFLSAYRGFRLCMHRNISPENKRPPNLLMNTHKCNKHQIMFLLLKAISLFYAHQNNNARFHTATAMLGHKYSPFIISNGIFQLSISWITSQQRWQTKFGEGIQMM